MGDDVDVADGQSMPHIQKEIRLEPVTLASGLRMRRGSAGSPLFYLDILCCSSRNAVTRRST